jgi:UDP-N-acetylmuramate dehydrogenase
MMAARRREDSLIDRLPQVRGGYVEDAPLHRWAWFRVGGPADVLFEPADADDLATFLAERPRDVPVTVLGLCSNLLVRDGGVRGVVVRLGRGFANVAIESETVMAGAGAADVTVARAAAEAGVAGLEFLRGVPGSIGGALRMNAGAYGAEIKDVLIEAAALDGEGRAHCVTAQSLGLSYRHSDAPADWIFIAATLRGRRGDPAAIAARMAQITEARDATQPTRSRTGGSTFKNPPGAKAWELIDRAGCRGLKRGAAQVSELHCNFLINLGGASAAELEGLGEEVRRRVREACGVELEWEIARLGEAAR